MVERFGMHGRGIRLEKDGEFVRFSEYEIDITIEKAKVKLLREALVNALAAGLPEEVAISARAALKETEHG